MAHECPECGMICFCGGDIGDIEFELEGFCRHCDKDDNDYEYDDWLDCETDEGE